jgi:hypothetical protein
MSLNSIGSCGVPCVAGRHCDRSFIDSYGAVTPRRRLVFFRPRLRSDRGVAAGGRHRGSCSAYLAFAFSTSLAAATGWDVIAAVDIRFPRCPTSWPVSATARASASRCGGRHIAFYMMLHVYFWQSVWTLRPIVGCPSPRWSTACRGAAGGEVRAGFNAIAQRPIEQQTGGRHA